MLQTGVLACEKGNTIFEEFFNYYKNRYASFVNGFEFMSNEFSSHLIILYSGKIFCQVFIHFCSLEMGNKTLHPFRKEIQLKRKTYLSLAKYSSDKKIWLIIWLYGFFYRVFSTYVEVERIFNLKAIWSKTICSYIKLAIFPYSTIIIAAVSGLKEMGNKTLHPFRKEIQLKRKTYLSPLWIGVYYH